MGGVGVGIGSRFNRDVVLKRRGEYRYRPLIGQPRPAVYDDPDRLDITRQGPATRITLTVR
jgi:hypothetical protein